MSFKSSLKIIGLLFAAMVLSACGSESVASDTQVPVAATPHAIQSPSQNTPAKPLQQSDKSIAQITFTDAKLADCVTATAKSRGWHRINQVSELACAGKSINSIGGIQNLTALKSLELQQNAISSLAPLSKLKSLTSVNLAGNKLVDIKPLGELTALEHLNLGTAGALDSAANSIRDISALSGLNALKSLNLSNNQLGDIAALKGLTKLQKLQLSGNQIRDIRAILDISYTAEVDLYDNNNIPCAELNELETLLAEGDLIRPFDCLFTLDILITDIGFPDQNLKSCVLDTASSEGWITISEMTELACDEQALTDLTGLQSLKALNYLDLRGNKLVDISPLFELNATADIDLGGNEKVACARLDALDAVLGSGIVNRPAQCAPVTLIFDLDFVDPVLEACVHHSAAQNGWKTIDQMVSLSCGKPWDNKIKDLRGIEQLTALSSVNLAAMLHEVQDGIDISALFLLGRRVQIDLSGHQHLGCHDLDALANSLDARLKRSGSCIK